MPGAIALLFVFVLIGGCALNPTPEPTPNGVEALDRAVAALPVATVNEVEGQHGSFCYAGVCADYTLDPDNLPEVRIEGEHLVVRLTFPEGGDVVYAWKVTD